MKIAFNLDTINYRGTTVAVSDYAKYNQDILGNESVIVYNNSIQYEKDMGSEKEAIEDLKTKFEVIGCAKHELNSVLKKEQVDLAYFIKYGHNDKELPDLKTAVHAVFQAKEPHGDRYAYISEWLAEKMGGDIPFVPHIVDLPEATDNYREKFNISEEQIVVGRYGGYYSFDLDFVKQSIIELLDETDKYVFMFVNTEPFYKHKNIIYIDSVVDRQKKSNFINTCDTMLHARTRGESFGLSVCEFLYHNKPVLAWNNGLDQNHMLLLKDTGTLYSEFDFKQKLANIKDVEYDWKGIVKKFEPKPVIEKFKEVFID